MSCIVDNSTLFDETDLATDKSVIIDMSQVDSLSIQIHIHGTFVEGPIITLNESVDGIHFAQVAKLDITTMGTTIWHVHPVFSQFKKVHYTANGGSATFDIKINAKNNSITSFGGAVTKVYGTS